MSMTGSGGPQNMAAHHAAQMIRQSHATVQQNMMFQRSRIFTVVLPPAPKTTAMGLEVTNTFTFTIQETEPIDGAAQYDLLVDGESVWSGMGDSLADALLQAVMRVTGEEDEIPND